MLKRIFSGSPEDLSRYNVLGLAVLALGVILVAVSKKASGGKNGVYYLLKFGGLLVVMLGALITIKVFG